jgi:hypothetical protein
MRKWKTMLWLVVLSFLSVSCGSRNVDRNPQVSNGMGNVVRPPGGGVLSPAGGGGGGALPPSGGASNGWPVLYASDGVYLGSVVPAYADSESICLPNGEFGSPMSPTSVWNRWGTYGSPSSPLSAMNPSAPRPPTICLWDGVQVSNCFAFLSKNRSLGYPTYDPDQLRQSLCR